VSREGFEARYEAELANEYGNLASRTINMLGRWSDGAVPVVETDPVLRADFADLFTRVDELLGRADLTAALDEIWQRVRRLNRYVEERAPWALAREPERADELAVVLASLAEGLRAVTVALCPYMPERTALLLEALGLPAGGGPRAFAPRGWGGAVAPLAPLFPKAVS
jgi:methionyl-tRNA synthetase